MNSLTELIISSSETATENHRFLKEEEGCQATFSVDMKTGSNSVTITPIENPYNSDPAPEFARHDDKAITTNVIPRGVYAKDAIDDSYKNWKLGDSVWINLNCGSGKTTFFTSTLKYFRDKGFKVLYLGSREQLMNQTKKAVARALNSIYADYPAQYVAPMKEIGNFIFFETYQSVSEKYRQGVEYRPDVFKRSRVAVFLDEIHWITSDATFSSSPDLFIKGFFKQFEGALKVFMSATDWDCFEQVVKNTPPIPLCYLPDSKKNSSCVFNQVYLSEDRTIENAEAFYYDSLDAIVPFITKSTEKWLILVESKELGKKLTSEISDSSFVFREKAGQFMDETASDEKSRVANEERFDCRVLISTAILDVGTNISDDAVVNLVADCWDPITLVQFFGRKRRKDGAIIKLYFHNRTDAEIKNYLKEKVNKPMYWAKKFVAGGENIRYLGREEFVKLYERELIYFHNDKLLINELGIAKLKNLRKYLHHILWESARFGDKSWLVHQLELLGLTINNCVDVTHDEKDEANAGMDKLLHSAIGTTMDIEKYTNFCKLLDKFLDKLGNKNHRGAIKYQVEKLNKVLTENNLKYKVQKTKDTYEVFPLNDK